MNCSLLFVRSSNCAEQVLYLHLLLMHYEFLASPHCTLYSFLIIIPQKKIFIYLCRNKKLKNHNMFSIFALTNQQELQK